MPQLNLTSNARFNRQIMLRERRIAKGVKGNGDTRKTTGFDRPLVSRWISTSEDLSKLEQEILDHLDTGDEVNIGTFSRAPWFSNWKGLVR